MGKIKTRSMVDRLRAVIFMVLLVSLGAVAPVGAATVIFSENFDNTAFEGSFIGNSTTDRYGSTAFYSINNINGWTFSGTTPFYARSASGADGAVVLNEGSGAASRTLTGLTVGATYSLSLLLSGDNVQGYYNLYASIDGTNILNQPGTVQASGTNAGQLVSAFFTAKSTSVTLGFSQSTSGTSSPMIDNVIISAVPEPTSWVMMTGGFGLIGAAMRRDRRNAARFSDRWSRMEARLS